MLKVNHNIKNILLGNLTKYRYCIGGFTQYFYIGQCLVVTFTIFATLWLVEASKCRQIVYKCYQRQVLYL